ncbi:hypothetical protein [Amycolatopsis sp. NPDC003861]
MQTVNFFQAWSMWRHGIPVGGLNLWTIPILWWGRFGKMAQAAGGLTVILDIIGPERFDKWAKRFTPQSARSTLKYTRSAVNNFLRDGDKVRFFRLAATSLVLLGPTALLCWPTIKKVFTFIGQHVNPDAFITALTVGGGGTLIIAAYLAFVSLIANLLTFTLTILRITVVRILSLAKSGHQIRIGSSLLILIGFSFDLLAS